VAGFNVGDEKPPHYYIGYLQMAVARIRWSRGAREAIATSVKVAGIGTSNIKAKELDSPLAGVRVW
jgi:hypothetical protein